MKPLISIIVNCHNGSKFLENCIQSILSQRYINYEVIFFDNCSTDDSRKILNKYHDKRIKYYYSANKLNLYHARNEALKKTKGKFIAFLDTDDWWKKNYLSSRSKVFLDKKYDYFYCNTMLHYNNKKKIYKNFSLPKGKIYNYLAKDYFIIISGAIIRKKILQKYKGFNSKFNIIGDYDLFMKISQKHYAHSINKPLINYRIHDKNFSRINTKIFYTEYKTWFKNNLTKKRNYLFKQNFIFFKRKLFYLKLKYKLSESKKSFSLLIEILKYPISIAQIKLLILFFLPKKFLTFLKR